MSLFRPQNNKNKRAKKPKRTNRGQGGGQAALATPLRRHIGFPDRFSTTLSYYIQKVDNWAATPATTYRYLATGPQQIDPVSGGGQPTYYDQFSLIYASQRTTRSRITVRGCAGANGSMPVNLVVVPLNADPGATPFTNFLQALTFPYAQNKMIPAYGGGNAAITSSMTTSKIFGSNMVLYDDNFASLVSTTPVNNWYWGIVLYNNFTLTATQPYTLMIELEFDIEFYDRKAVVDA